VGGRDVGQGDAREAIGYSEPVADVLDAVGDLEGPLGSGAATALSLSLAVECLSLHRELSNRGAGSEERTRYLEGLEGRLEEWRKACRDAFVADQTHFGEVIAARRAQRVREGDGKRRHAEREMVHLACANDVLLALLDVAARVGRDAGVMVATHGSRVGEGEGATAGFLAGSARDAAATMLASNVRSAANRAGTLGVLLPRRAAILTACRKLPSGPARDFLEAELERLEAASRAHEHE